MALKIRPNERTAHGLRRSVKKELESAAAQLSVARPNHHAIHEARKSLKKVRAILQLVGDELHAGAGARKLRRAARLIAPLRDAEVLVETARALCSRERDPHAARSCRPFADLLKRDELRLMMAARRKQTLKRAARLVAEVRDDAGEWRWKTVDFAVLVTAIGRSYKRAKKAMRRARAHPGSELFHTWRKRVKTLWYGMRLIEECAPAVARDVATLGRIEEWLGDEHNLTVLRSHTRRRRLPMSEHAALVRIGAFAERRQTDLRRMALRAGSRVFRRKPKVFARRIGKRRRKLRRA